MKQLLLMRHAKSSWDNQNLKDFDRPLAKRGLQDAPMMGEFIRNAGYKPGYVMSSSAKRARQTTQLSMEAAKVDEKLIQWNDDLYFGSVSDYFAVIQSVSDETERLLMVGHNPLMEQTAGLLAGADQRITVRMPTAALICMQSFADHWESISPGTCQIKWMMIPKVLKKLE